MENSEISKRPQQATEKGLPQPAFPLCNLPQGGELNTSGAERRSELTSPRGANQKGRKPVLSQGAEGFFIRKLVFPHPANDRSGRLERALGSERVYLGGVEAELRQDFVIMLTQMRSTSFESG